MRERLEAIRREVFPLIRGQETLIGLEKARVDYLGRKGRLTELLRGLSGLEGAERAEMGAAANLLKSEIEVELGKRRAGLAGRADGGAIDVTEPGLLPPVGHLHPITQVVEEALDVFHQLGYDVADGPEAETDWYNFEALNMPPDHPARDMQDTLYLENGLVARTHTSPVQVRYMETHKPPLRVIVPGRVYRNEDEDASHAWIFTQLEGLAIDRGLSMADLRGTLEAVVRGVLGDETQIRLRPSFFPYTEPSAEVDATCPTCGGKGCSGCGQTGWLELCGAGMVHPQVIKNGGHDPAEWQGFAFGMGAERLAMVKYGIPDVRLFWRPDLRFLEQF